MNLEAYKTHLVFERLEQLKLSLQAENLVVQVGIDNYDFFDTVYSYVKSKLRLTNPVLVQDGELMSLASEIESGTFQINTFIGNQNFGHITNAVNSLSSAVTRTRNLPIPTSTNDFDFSKDIAGYKQTVESAYNELKIQNEKLKSDLETVQADLTTKQDTLKGLELLLAEKQNEIRNVLNKNNTEFELLKTNVNSTVDTETQRFSDIFEANRKTFKESIEAEKETFKVAYQNQKAYFELEAKSIIEGLNKKLFEAKEIVNIVGNIGVTGNYQIIANQHKSSANFFRWVALGFMVVMSSLLIYSIIELSNKDFNLQKSLVRILAAAVLTYPAVYAAKESSRHRNLETQNRNLELELASIGPFIELLTDEKKQSIKEGLVSKYFGKNNLPESVKKDEGDEVSINGLEKILKTILPYLNK